MWARNCLFIVLCLGGLAMIAKTLLDRNRIDRPRTFYGGQAKMISAAGAKKPAASTANAAQTPKIWPSREASNLPAVVAHINGEFRAHWQAMGLSPAGLADDLTIARRLSLALTGTIPSVEEIRALEQVRPEDRVEWWVAHLLEDRRYADYVAERLARAYVGTENGPFILYRRRRFVTWLADQLARDERYDAIVRELIADTGLWNASPATNFMTVTADNNKENDLSETRLAGRTTRAFLGMRIDCLECHDDKLGNVSLGDDGTRSGKQADFHQLAAFFSQAEIHLTGVQDVPEKKYEYKYLNAEKEVVVPPRVPFGEEFFLGEGTRREQLARWVTSPKNKPFARATVNRIWALMFGKPLVEPVDDIPLQGPFPPALETLSDDLITHEYDLQRLIRIIAACEVYQQDSQADFEVTSDHENAWAAFPLTRLRPEQVAGAIIQSSSLSTINAQAHLFSQLTKFFQTGEFVERYGDLGEDEFLGRGGTIPQRLIMMNGNLVKERTDGNPIQNASTRITMVTASPEKSVETAYLATLTRRPTAEERAALVARLNDAKLGGKAERMEDVYWVLLNSTEFSWNH